MLFDMSRQPKPLPSAEFLHSLFTYDPASGSICAKVDRTNRKIGQRADTDNYHQYGYRRVAIDKSHYLAHRIAWKMHYGRDPDLFIDHINGDTSDNRIYNLRECAHAMNSLNRKTPSHNTTGVKGVHVRKRNGKFVCRITVRGVHHHLGDYDSLEVAEKVVEQARIRLHGDFRKR
jgi:hypothetical protein